MLVGIAGALVVGAAGGLPLSFLSWVSTCAVEIQDQLLRRILPWGTFTKPCFQLLDVAPLRPTLASDFIVCAIVIQSRACSARRPFSVTFQFPLSTYDTSNSLLSGLASLIHGAFWVIGGFIAVINM